MTYPHPGHRYGQFHPGAQHTYGEPLFSVRVRKHYGLFMAWSMRTYTITGTRTQCEQALHQAQIHNVLAGWWSPLSLLLLNWIALIANASERSRLHRAAIPTNATR
ncbi:hypothetical protein B1R94_27655 [Mycolicibacterium litorale]|nr:hypothetical protein B1R94_27655 [Mycolicibacterium litorale]